MTKSDTNDEYKCLHLDTVEVSQCCGADVEGDWGDICMSCLEATGIDLICKSCESQLDSL